LGKIIVVTSGKGGVGKTTTSASFAVGLASRGHKTVVIDFDIGLRNLDLIMGCERRVIYDFVNVIHGEAKLSQALIRDKRIERLYTLPASQTRDKDALTLDGVSQVLRDLQQDLGFEYIICDSPAGIERGAFMALYFSDEAIVVTNPEISSVRDSDRILGILTARSRRAVEELDPIMPHLLITRYNADRVMQGEMMSMEDIKSILGIPVIGVIPESESVLNASNTGTPVILDEKSTAATAYADMVDRFLGDSRPMRFVNFEKRGLLKRLFARSAS